MSEITRENLFGKLNSLAYKAIESATVFCKMRGNPYVELVHWLHQVLQVQDSDLHRIIKHFDLNPSTLAKQMTDALDRLPRGATSISDLSYQVQEAVERLVGLVQALNPAGQVMVASCGQVIHSLRRPRSRGRVPLGSEHSIQLQLPQRSIDQARIQLISRKPETLQALGQVVAVRGALVKQQQQTRLQETPDPGKRIGHYPSAMPPSSPSTHDSSSQPTCFDSCMCIAPL